MLASDKETGSRKLIKRREGWSCVFASIHFLFGNMSDWLTSIEGTGWFSGGVLALDTSVLIVTVLSLNAAKWVAQSRLPLSKVALIHCSKELPRNLCSHFDLGSCLIPAQGNVATASSMHAGLVGDQSKSFWVWLWVSAVCPVMDRWHVHMSSCLSPSVRWGATPACALTLTVDGNRKRMEFHRQAAFFSRRIY